MNAVLAVLGGRHAEEGCLPFGLLSGFVLLGGGRERQQERQYSGHHR